MNTACTNFIFWRPVILRAALWIVISMLTQFLAETKDLTRAHLATWFWLDWTKLVVGVLLSGFITWRTFLDQTLSNHIKRNETPPHRTPAAA